MPVRVWQAADLLPRSRSSSSAANANRLSISSQHNSSHSLAGSQGNPLSVAVNATYSEVTARTRVCLHIDITAGRKTLGRQREGGRESRDLIPSKLSADLLAVIW